jgi:DNA invertase Pin-like site-specific DNA recombinase
VRRTTDYIAKKGWTLDNACIFNEDDGISGAEFSKRHGLVRLLSLLHRKPRPPF